MRPADYQRGAIRLWLGDARELLPAIGEAFDVSIADPPYGETDLAWDIPVSEWVPMLPTKCLWCFGSMRFFMAEKFLDKNGRPWRFAQDIVWEKHNGSGFHADRFKRVHEHACQFYLGEWRAIYKSTVKTNDATARTIRRKTKPAHTGDIRQAVYVSQDGGPRLMRSVIAVRSCHGKAVHPTQKPTGIVEPLVEYSVPRGGSVIDPFAGSGTVGVVCIRLGRSYVGFENNREHFENACTRLDAEFDRYSMFETKKGEA